MKLHGCTVHLVTQEMDAGPILAQAAVPVLPDDTEDSLAQRVLRQEHVDLSRRPGRLRCGIAAIVAFFRVLPAEPIAVAVGQQPTISRLCQPV